MGPSWSSVCKRSFCRSCASKSASVCRSSSARKACRASCRSCNPQAESGRHPRDFSIVKPLEPGHLRNPRDSRRWLFGIQLRVNSETQAESIARALTASTRPDRLLRSLLSNPDIRIRAAVMLGIDARSSLGCLRRSGSIVVSRSIRHGKLHGISTESAPRLQFLTAQCQSRRVNSARVSTDQRELQHASGAGSLATGCSLRKRARPCKGSARRILGPRRGCGPGGCPAIPGACPGRLRRAFPPCRPWSPWRTRSAACCRRRR